MQRISLKTFKKIISSRYSERSSNIQNVLIEIGDDLYAKSETLAILKAVNPVINPLKVKKIVSLNSNQKLTIDSAISTNIFTLDEELTEGEKHLFQKDQLLFVEDDNTKIIKVYKILFNESEGENSAELVELRAMSLRTFNDLFINSGLFKDNNLIVQKINRLLQDSNDQNPFYELVWNQEHFNAIDYSSNIEVIKNFKKHLKLDNVEKDYFFYRQGNEVIIKNISNPNDTFKIQINANTISNNDILYLNKSAGENGEVCWKAYKITKTTIPGLIYNNVKYQAHEVQSLTDQEFNDLLDLLSIIPQSGFTISAENDNGLASCLTTEQKNIGSAGVFYCKKRQEDPLVELERLPEPLAIADDNAATIRTVFANKSQEGLYSLVIEDDKVKITDLKSEPESLFFEQPLFPENKEDWSLLFNTNRHYEKVYFVKNLNNDLVEKWVVNNEQHQLQCVQIVELANLRKNFANNNLFYVPELIATEGIHLGENGAEVAARASQRHTTTSSPVAIYNIINLNWDDDIKMWNLNVTTHGNTLDTKLKFEEKESLILKKIITATNNANTVILFNKYDGKFLRAYYINENNKKVNCSNILTNEEKNCLSNINKKAKERVEKPIVVNPKYYNKLKYFSKSNDKIFKLSYFNNKWHVLCTEEYEVTKQIKAEIKLTEKEGDLLLKLVHCSRDIDITFDKNNNFKVIEYVNFLNKDKTRFIKKNSLTADDRELLQKVFTAIEDKENLKPENNDIQWKRWDCSTSTIVNNIPDSAVTDSSQLSPQQL